MTMEYICKRLKRCSFGRRYTCCYRSRDRRNNPMGCQSQIELPGIGALLDSEMNDKRQENIEKLKNTLQWGATLVLGSGVSIPAGLPDWAGLISRMSGYALQYQQYIESNTSDIKNQVRLAQLERELISGDLKILGGVNMLEAGQYISQQLEATREQAGEDLLKEVLTAIVEESKTAEDYLAEWKKLHPGMEPERGDIASARAVAHDNTLCAVAYLLQAKGGFRRAMTYNYDTLVQEYLISVFGISESRIVSHSEQWTPFTERDPIEIIHLHGCIPRVANRGRGTAFPQESHRVILSEDSYYDTERNGAYNWQNSVQSFFLNRESCAFVGFSADDYNFRRILRQLGKCSEHHAHFLFMTVDQIALDTLESVCQNRLKVHRTVCPDVLKHDALLLLNRQLSMKARYWENKYHFFPIWVTIADIPKTLLSILP